MKYPCKTCLVKPACSEECSEYNIFMEKLKDVWAPLLIGLYSMLFLGTCFAVILHYPNEQALHAYIKWLWWSSMMILLILDWRMFFEHIFLSVLLSPIMMPAMLVWKIQAKIYKRF